MPRAGSARVGLHDRSAQPRQSAALASQLQGPPRPERGLLRAWRRSPFAQVNWSRGQAVRADPAAGRRRATTSRCSARRSSLGRAFHRRRGSQGRRRSPSSATGSGSAASAAIPHIVGKTITLNRVAVHRDRRRRRTASPARSSAAVRPAWVPMSMHDVVQPNFDWYEQRRGSSSSRLRTAQAGRHDGAGRAQHADDLRGARAGVSRRQQGRSAGAVSLLDARLNPQGAGRRASRAALRDPDGASSGSSCSSPAPTSPICSSRAPRRAARRSRSGWRWARADCA